MRRTSGCWGTFTELIVLAQQSVPTRRVLRNTCAGIKSAETFGRSLKVRVSKGDESHLELGFDSDDEPEWSESGDEIDFG
jgi:hypothetical protein